jgi:hypothetical protein
MLHAFVEGMEHKPQTAFGNVKSDVLEEVFGKGRVSAGGRGRRGGRGRVGAGPGSGHVR